jgi:MFS family permease
VDAAFATLVVLLVGTGLATFLLLPAAEPDSSSGDAAGAGSEAADTPGATDPAAREPTRSWLQMLRFAPVQAALTVQTVVALGWGAGATFLAIYVISEDGLGTESATFVGLLLACRALIGGVLQPVFGRLADRMSRLVLVMAGLLLSAGGHFAIPALPGATLEVGTFVIAPWLLAIFVLIGLAEAIAFPAQQAIFVEVGRSVGMGSVMGLTQMGSSLGFLAGSVFGAGVVELFGLAAVFRYAGLVVFAGALLFFVLMLRARADFAALRAPGRAEAPPIAPG